MLSSFLHLLQKTFALSLQYMGTSALAVIAGLALFFFKEGYTWRQEGRDAVRKRWKGAAGYGALLTVGLWLCLLVWCATQIVYGDHRVLSSQKSALDTEVQRLSTENTGLIIERDKLKTDNEGLKRNPSRTQPAQEAEQRCWLSNFFGMPTSTVKGAVTASAAVIHCNKKIDAPFEVAVEFDRDFLPGAITLPDSGVVMGSGEAKQGKIYVGRINNPPLLSDQLIVVTVYGNSDQYPRALHARVQALK